MKTITRKYLQMNREQRKSTKFNGDEIILDLIDEHMPLLDNVYGIKSAMNSIVTVGPNATGEGTAVYIQDGNTPARNCFGNETGKTILEEYLTDNLWVEQDGYHRGVTFAGK